MSRRIIVNGTQALGFNVNVGIFYEAVPVRMRERERDHSARTIVPYKTKFKILISRKQEIQKLEIKKNNG